jgi:hypothetical protein
MPLLRRALWGAVAEPADVLSSGTDAVTSSSSGSLTSAVTDTISNTISSTMNSSSSSSSSSANANSSSNGSSSGSSHSSAGGAFVIRGPTWCDNGCRVQGGSPLCRLVHAELYAVRHPAGRADHIRYTSCIVHTTVQTNHTLSAVLLAAQFSLCRTANVSSICSRMHDSRALVLL